MDEGYEGLPELLPYMTHQDESLRFTSAIVYLVVAAEMAEAKPESELGAQHVIMEKHLGKAFDSPRSYFMTQLFVARIASFEQFLQDTVSLVIENHPKKVGNMEFKLGEILDCENVGVLVKRAADNFMNALMQEAAGVSRSDVQSAFY